VPTNQDGQLVSMQIHPLVRPISLVRMKDGSEELELSTSIGVALPTFSHCREAGSVRGVPSNGHPYRDPGPFATVPDGCNRVGYQGQHSWHGTKPALMTWTSGKA
jgi:hypothetical protein